MSTVCTVLWSIPYTFLYVQQHWFSVSSRCDPLHLWWLLVPAEFLEGDHAVGGETGGGLQEQEVAGEEQEQGPHAGACLQLPGL